MRGRDLSAGSRKIVSFLAGAGLGVSVYAFPVAAQEVEPRPLASAVPISLSCPVTLDGLLEQDFRSDAQRASLKLLISYQNDAPVRVVVQIADYGRDYKVFHDVLLATETNDDALSLAASLVADMQPVMDHVCFGTQAARDHYMHQLMINSSQLRRDAAKL